MIKIRFKANIIELFLWTRPRANKLYVPFLILPHKSCRREPQLVGCGFSKWGTHASDWVELMPLCNSALSTEPHSTFLSSRLGMTKETFRLPRSALMFTFAWAPLPASFRTPSWAWEGRLRLPRKCGQRCRSTMRDPQPLPVSQLLLRAGGKGVWEAGRMHIEATQTGMSNIPTAARSAERRAHP